jgi:small conductance mechanosensitive channel
VNRVLAAAPLDDVGVWARTRLLEAILVTLGAVLLARLVGWVGDLVTARIDAAAADEDALVRSEGAKHRQAVSQVLRYVAIALIYSLAVVVALQRLGVPVTGFVAPATVAGVGIGFGAQRVVQDILSGFFLITEKQYGYGDVVTLSVAGISVVRTGTVEDLTLRITRIRMADGSVVITPNGQISQVVNLSRDWARAVVDVPIPLSADVRAVNDLLRSVCAAALDDEELHPLLLDAPTVMGIDSLEVGALNVQVVARTLPGRQFEVSRALRARIAAALVTAGVTAAADTAAITIETGP